MDILKGYINKTFKKDGALKAQIQIDQEDPIEDVLMIFPYGIASNPQNSIDGALVLLFMNRALNFAIPYNPLLEPLLGSGEVAVGDFNVGNKATFKSNGDIEIETSVGTLRELVNALEVTSQTQITFTSPTITNTAATSITLSAPLVTIGAGAGLALNNLASMQVTIPGGSSAGTYPVTITGAGQSTVNI